MNSAIIFFAIIGCGLCMPDGMWSQGGGGSSGRMSPGSSRGMSSGGSWQNDQNSGRQENQRMGGWASGQSSGRGMGGQGRAISGSGGSGGPGGDGRYGANIIDTPSMVGYDATIPGATSRFVFFRSEGGRGAKSQDGGLDQGGRSGQGSQWQNSGSRGGGQGW